MQSIKLWKKGKNYKCKQNIKLPKVCQADLKVPQFCLIGGILCLAGEGPALLQQRPEGLLLQAGQRSHPLQYSPTHGRHEKKFEHLYNLALPSARPSRHWHPPFLVRHIRFRISKSYELLLSFSIILKKETHEFQHYFARLKWNKNKSLYCCRTLNKCKLETSKS